MGLIRFIIKHVLMKLGARSVGNILRETEEQKVSTAYMRRH